MTYIHSRASPEGEISNFSGMTKPGKIDEYLSTLKPKVPIFVREKGCIEYCPTADVETGLPPQILDENVITIIEEWETIEDLMAHLNSPHYIAYKKSS